MIGNPGIISKGSKVFLRENLNCHFLETKDRRKLKFSEVSLKKIHFISLHSLFYYTV